MVEFIDKTNEQDGTPINRENLMAIQGFVSSTVIFNQDGSMTETNEKNETLTTYPWELGEKIMQRIVFQGERTITILRTIHNGIVEEKIQ